MLQNNLPMQHHEDIEPSIHSSSSEPTRLMEERLMISSVDSTSQDKKNSNATNDETILSEEGHIII